MKTIEVTIDILTSVINDALKGCENGKVNESLKMLYKTPFREHVPWDRFPSWARPLDPVEGGHEG